MFSTLVVIKLLSFEVINSSQNNEELRYNCSDLEGTTSEDIPRKRKSISNQISGCQVTFDTIGDHCGFR